MIGLSSVLPSAVIQDLGWTLIHFAWQGAALALLLAAVLPASRSAQERYQAAFVTLIFMLAAPVITFVVIHAEVRGATSLQGEVWQRVGEISATQPWIDWIVTAWIGGATVLGVRAGGGWCLVSSLRTRDVCELPQALAQRCAALARLVGVRDPLTFLQSSLATVPFVVGWFRPAVLLPVAVVTRLPLHQIEALVLHELAHIRRNDAVANLFQIVVETLLFYHPAVWWVSDLMRRERENCCDDVAVELSGDAVTYARALTALEAMRPASPFALAANGGVLRQRVVRLLHAPARAGRSPIFAAIVAVLGLTGYAALPPAAPPAVRIASDDAVAIHVLADGDLAPLALPDLASPTVILAATPLQNAQPRNAALEIPGVSHSYMHDMRRLLPDIRTPQIVAFNTNNVTAEDVRATQSIWPTVSAAEILALRAVNLNLTDVADFQRAGLNTHELPPIALVVYKTTGVSPALVRALQSVGVAQILPNDYVTAQVHGLTPEFLAAVRNHKFHGLSMQGLLALKRTGAFG